MRNESLIRKPSNEWNAFTTRLYGRLVSADCVLGFVEVKLRNGAKVKVRLAGPNVFGSFCTKNRFHVWNADGSSVIEDKFDMIEMD